MTTMDEKDNSPVGTTFILPYVRTVENEIKLFICLQPFGRGLASVWVQGWSTAIAIPHPSDATSFVWHRSFIFEGVPQLAHSISSDRS